MRFAYHICFANGRFSAGFRQTRHQVPTRSAGSSPALGVTPSYLFLTYFMYDNLQLGFGIKAKAFPLAEKRYSDLHYHNFGHALEVMEAALILANTCRKYEIPVEMQVVGYATLYHDTNYADDPKFRGFKSREEQSAAAAGKDLTVLKVDKRTIENTKACINSTHHFSDFATVEQKIVRASDLKGFAGSYDKFLQNTLLLRKEHELLNGKKVSAKDWKLMTAKTGLFYLSQDIRITPKHDDASGASVFHISAARNLYRSLSET